MSRTFGQWFRFLAVCVAVGVMVTAMHASLGVTKEEVRNEVRMSVDPTVLPIVLHDGSIAQVPTEDDSAIDGENSLPPDSADETSPQSSQTAAKETQSEPVVVTEPEPESASAPAPAAKPTPKTAPKSATGPGTVNAVNLAENATGFTITVQANKPVGDTSYMNLNNPKRLVIDLRDKWSFNARNVIRSKGVVKHIVIGEHPDRLRLVVHFNTPPKGRLNPSFTRTGKTLEVNVPLP